MLLLLSGKFKVLEIKKKTKAKFFKDLKVGDEFELIYTLNGSYKSAPLIEIYVDGIMKTVKYASEIINILEKNFVIKQVVHTFKF